LPHTGRFSRTIGGGCGEAMEPNLETNKAPIIIAGTPPEGTKSYYSKVEKDFANTRGYKTFCLPSYLNTYLYPEGKEDKRFKELRQRYIERGEEDVFEREYLAKYVKGGSRAIFPVFKSPTYDETGETIVEYSEHVRPHDEIKRMLSIFPKDWEYYVAYDAGTVTCFAVLLAALNTVTRQVIYLDEIYEKDQSKTTSISIYRRAQDLMLEYGEVDWYEVYDNAAAWFANEVNAEEEDACLIPCTKDYNRKEDRLSMIKDMMIRGYHLESERCKFLRWETENYYIDDKGKIPKSDDHLQDCRRYRGSYRSEK
jgi:hypothetical protein